MVQAKKTITIMISRYRPSLHLHHRTSITRYMNRLTKINKQRSLVYLPEAKKKIDNAEVAVQSSPRGKQQLDLNEEEIKKLRLKRLNLRLKQNKLDQHWTIFFIYYFKWIQP